MIFLTVGTSFPFDRLVKALDHAVSNNNLDIEIFAQVGKGGYRPKSFDSVELLKKNTFDEYFQNADAVIAHAGMGTIEMALKQRKPILVMPRLKKHGEIVNNHQLITSKRFEELGHVMSAYTQDDLIQKIPMLKTFIPVQRESSVEQVSARIGEFLYQCLGTVKR